jgi:hypothetical protein
VFSISFLLPIYAISQNTIQADDVFKTGSKYIVSYDMPDFIDIGAGGVHQVWNYRNAFTHSLYDTVEVFTSGNNPLGNVAGNIALLKNIGQIDGQFYNKTSQSLIQADIKTANTDAIYHTQGDFKILQFPVQYNQQYSGNFRADNQFYVNQDLGLGFWVDSIRVRRYIAYTVDVDGEGIIKTDLGEFDVLRIKIYYKGTDTADFYNASTNTWYLNADLREYDYNRFYFWSNKVSYPIAIMYDFVLANMVSDIEVLTQILQQPNPTSVVSELSQSALKIYPNPNSKFLHVEGNDPNSPWEIFDGKGAKIAHGLQKTIITEHLPKGNYWLKLQENGTLKMKRIIKL